MSPAFGSTQQMAVSPAITPASPGLYSGFASVVITFAHVNNDTPFDKCSVAKTFPLLRRRIVIEQIVKFLTGLHLLERIVLASGFFKRCEKFLTRFHRNAERALRENDHSISKIRELLKREQRTFPELSHVRH